ncbi:Hypothetical predicted protein [Cloeon dipterum]|uniref:SCP domain-containing protein n=1 Tax=Cloeon dipterum TaxID=197152 RepID=A0A8S1CRZ1_9INSE|nr:Hypothetical predicted protein [Cloeon dipterum]
MCLRPRNCAPGKFLVSRDTQLSIYDKDALVRIHNKLRSFVATGKLPHHPPAKNMNELTWDDELAEVAQRWAEQCTFGHDRNRTVDRFAVGQNVAYEWWSPGPAPIIILSSTIAMFNEVDKPGYPAPYISQFQVVPQTGHFTQIVWADTSRIGCGRSIYNETKNGKVGETKLLVCNFGKAGNFINQPVYETGEPDCAVFSNQYKGLCTTNQVNEEFKDPCQLETFKSNYLPLCNDELFFSLGLFGAKYNPDRDYSRLILLSLGLMLLAAAVMGLLCFMYRRFLPLL